MQHHSKEQLEQFDREGYLFFPGQFTREEMKALIDEVPELYSRREAYNVREKGKDAVGTNFAAHMYSKPFAKLARHPRMVQPVMDLFDEAVYMHQFKINGKMAFEGERPEYIAHRDFTPIACLPDDCLLKDYPVELPWKDGVPASAMQTTSVPFDEMQAA